MPADSSIYSLLRPVAPTQGPLDTYGQAMQLQTLLGQQDVQQMQREQMRRGIEEEDAVKRLFQTGRTPTEAEVMGVSPTRGMAYGKNLRETQKADAEVMKLDRENFVAFADNARKRLATVRDPQSWQAYRDEQIAMAGMFKTPEIRAQAMRAAQSMPPQFDPNYIRDSLVKAEDLFTPKPQQVKMPDGSIQTVDMNPFTNPKALNFTAPRGMTPAEEDAKKRGWEGIGIQRETMDRNDWEIDKERGVRINRRTNQVEPIMAQTGGTGERQPLGPSPKAQREQADSLRKEFEGKEAVKSYRDVVPIAEAARASPDTRAGDIQLAYAVGKILDPASVVREGELKLVGNAATVMERVSGELRTLALGKGRLTPATRAELQKMLDSAVAQRKGAYDAERGSFEGIVKRRGLDAQDVFIDTPKSAPSGKPPQDPTIGGPKKRVNSLSEADPAQFTGQIATGDDGTRYRSDGKRWVKIP